MEKKENETDINKIKLISNIPNKKKRKLEITS